MGRREGKRREDDGIERGWRWQCLVHPKARTRPVSSGLCAFRPITVRLSKMAHKMHKRMPTAQNIHPHHMHVPWAVRPSPSMAQLYSVHQSVTHTPLAVHTPPTWRIARRRKLAAHKCIHRVAECTLATTQFTRRHAGAVVWEGQWKGINNSPRPY